MTLHSHLTMTDGGRVRVGLDLGTQARRIFCLMHGVDVADHEIALEKRANGDQAKRTDQATVLRKNAENTARVTFLKENVKRGAAKIAKAALAEIGEYGVGADEVITHIVEFQRDAKDDDEVDDSVRKVESEERGDARTNDALLVVVQRLLDGAELPFKPGVGAESLEGVLESINAALMKNELRSAPYATKTRPHARTMPVLFDKRAIEHAGLEKHKSEGLLTSLWDLNVVLKEMGRICQSSRTAVCISHVRVSGKSVQFIGRSSSRARAERGLQARKALGDTIAVLQEAQDGGWKALLLRRALELAQGVFPRRSVGGNVTRAKMRALLLENNFELAKSFADGITAGKSKTASVTNPLFGLPSGTYDSLRENPLTLDELIEGGHVIEPVHARAFAERFVAVRRPQDLLNIFEKVFVGIDPGTRCLCTCVFAKFTLRAEDREELQGLAANGSLLEDGKARQIFANATLMFHAKDVRGRRKRYRPLKPTKAVREAVVALSRTALETGKLGSSMDATKAYMDVYKTHFKTLYAHDWQDACTGTRGRMHVKNILRHQNNAADVRKVIDGVQALRHVLAVKEGDKRRTRRHRYDKKVVVFFGQCTFGGLRGSHKVATESFRRALSKRCLVIVVDEYLTSQLSWCCGAKMVKTRGHSYRYWRCPNRESKQEKGRDGKLRSSAEENKDVVACISMLRIGLGLILDGTRPVKWARPARRAAKM